ncbi:MAG: hypothetical protein ACRC8Y_26305, partial [Chroococcales cyanobacterium]
ALIKYIMRPPNRYSVSHLHQVQPSPQTPLPERERGFEKYIMRPPNRYSVSHLHQVQPSPQTPLPERERGFDKVHNESTESLYTLIVDKSGSMMTPDGSRGKTRWSSAEESTFALAAKCEQLDPASRVPWLLPPVFNLVPRLCLGML